MAANIESKNESTTNPCCQTWEAKYLKLQKKVTKVEDGRAALKKAIGIYEKEFGRLQNETLKFKNAFEEEKLQTDNERKEKEKESAALVSMENEISALKAEILSLSQKRGSVSENVSEELILLKQCVSDKEKEISCLQDEKKRAMADKSRTEQELNNLKTQLHNVEAEKKGLMQDLQKERKRADEMLKTAKTKLADIEHLKTEINNNDLETEIGRLKELVENERKRADCEAKKAETEKKAAHKVKEKLKAEQSRIDELLKVAKIKQAEVEALKTEKNNNDLETEIGRLKELLENERKRADCEAKKAETEKKTAHKVKEMLKAEQSRADEQRKLVEVERKKYEEFAHQLQKSKCEADEAKAKLVSEGIKFKEANKKFEAEKKRSIKEKKKAEEQQKIAEMSTKHALEEKQNAVRLQQQLDECQNKYDKQKKEMENYETNMKNHGQVKQTNIDKDKETENTKAAEMYKLRAMKEKARADKLVKQLEDTKKRINNEHKVTQDLVSSKSSTDTMNVSFAEMKLLKKKLKFEKERVKHFDQVAELEKRCKKTVEEELNRLKLEFALFSSRVGLCGCFDLNNVGKSCLEKNENVNLKRQCMQAGSGKELAKITKPSEYLKPNLDTSAPSLPLSGTCTESTAGTASKMEPLCNRKKLDSFALVSSRSSFSDRHLPLPMSRLSSANAEVADNNVKSPLKVRNIDGNTKKRKRLSNATESVEHLCTQGETRNAKLAKNNDKPLLIEYNKEKTVVNEELENFKKMFDGDCMRLLSLDSEIEEERYRAAVERPLSPTLPNIEFESSLIVLEDSRTSDSEIPVITTESWPIVVFSEIRNTRSLYKIFHMTKSFSSQLRTYSESDLLVKNIMSTISADEILSPKEKVCVFFSLFLKSFSSISLTNFDNANDGNFSSNIHTISGQLKKVMSDVETRTGFEKVCDFEELIALIQDFLINEEILICSSETSSETPSLPKAKASLHELVVGAVFLASVCEAFDRVDFLCELSYTISHVTSSLTSTLLHVFAYACGEKLLTHGDYNLIMTVVKSLVIYHERENVSSGFPSCATCPFSIGAIYMEELASCLLKKLGDCTMRMSCNSSTVPDDSLSDLDDVLSLLELLATKRSWSWVCKNVVSELLKMLGASVMETPLTSIFVLLGQMARLGIDSNGFQDADVEGIRVKLMSFISESASRKISLPVQFAAVTALLGTTPLSFKDICMNSIELLPPVSSATATDCIQRWFSLMNNECKSLSAKALNC
ncbi:uncharacterized protein LOC143561605 [Bidens hawaiensis]|uniref:uncharacterized protein LOC143561605 n=1 Tax=Bidens hawaiensis TaxID=980011 RepID=UPI00404AB03E